MDNIRAYKGIRPGKILAHELKVNNMTQKQLAKKTGVFAQTISAIVRGSRDISQELSFKLDKEFGYEDGFFLLIQTYYKIRTHAEQGSTTTITRIPKIRKVVFWDIDMKSLNWKENKDFIINRVNQRGSEEEKKKIEQYYATTQKQTTL